ncbi:MAG TPA: hypothetical protein PLS81_00020 [Deltaproteobacteria bacterium]|nr:hypothetical protein [Deltaproteobacteria bacterium]HOM27827.1 hypothetical protein [Deltaproteobacteria bacterium]HPP81599.1 hypothetical protein [Deltaproteobacteria bacterium]
MKVRIFSSDPLYLLLAVQMVIQIVLVFFVVLLLVVEKRRRMSADALEELRKVVDQTRELSQAFQENVQQRVDVLGRLMAELDDKTASARRLVNALEEVSVKAKRSRQFGQEDVKKLHKGGYDPLEISQITGIPVGEIQLMIKVGEPRT